MQCTMPNATSTLGIVVKALTVAAALAGLVAVLGATGACPLCEAVTGQLGFGTAAFAQLDHEAVERPAAPAADTPAAKPDLAGTMWGGLYKDLNGKAIDLGDIAGKPMVIELWATWCGPCRKQREHMHAMSQEYPDVAFVAASVDQGGGGAVRIYIAEKEKGVSKTSKVIDVLATPELQARFDKFNPSPSIPKVGYVNRKGELIEVALGTQKPEFMKAMLKNLTKPK
jgi:thiol-disulfide isomerase/thioredoxin